MDWFTWFDIFELVLSSPFSFLTIIIIGYDVESFVFCLFRESYERVLQIPIELNRCAMACQGCGAVLFIKKAVELLSIIRYC